MQDYNDLVIEVREGRDGRSGERGKDDRGQRSEVRSQRSEDGRQMTEGSSSRFQVRASYGLKFSV